MESSSNKGMKLIVTKRNLIDRSKKQELEIRDLKKDMNKLLQKTFPMFTDPVEQAFDTI